MRGVPLASGRDERKKVGKLLISYEKKLSNYRIWIIKITVIIHKDLNFEK